ncbi:MAG: cysteine desulfurase family protein [Planctomycetota bacterium]
MDLIYLDNNATTRPTQEVSAAVAEAHDELWGNPSSVHRFGQRVRQRLELARAATASLLGARPRELVFTSGGTESCALAIRGLRAAQRGAERFTLVTTDIEHAAVRELAEAMATGGEGRTDVVKLPLSGGGVADASALPELLANAAGPVLVSVQWANNETGAIQPIAELAAAVADARQVGAKTWLHSDATQAVGKLPVDAPASGVDLISFAAHKFHGPKGVGGLWLRRGVRVRPVQLGGPQETERRGGTENVPGVLGMGVAAKQAAEFLADPTQRDAIANLRDDLERRIADGLRDAGHDPPVVNSASAPRLWNTTNLGFRGLEAEAILLGLSERGVCASAGAACSSGSLEPSPVLRAMGIDEPVAHGSVRLSLSRFTTTDEIGRAAEVLVAVVARLGQVLPV